MIEMDAFLQEKFIYASKNNTGVKDKNDCNYKNWMSEHNDIIDCSNCPIGCKKENKK